MLKTGNVRLRALFSTILKRESGSQKRCHRASQSHASDVTVTPQDHHQTDHPLDAGVDAAPTCYGRQKSAGCGDANVLGRLLLVVMLVLGRRRSSLG